MTIAIRPQVAGKLESIQVGRTCSFEPSATHDKPWKSAIIKLPIEGQVTVTRLGLAGDEQKEKKIHGGPDKAILGYCAEHYVAWRTEHPAFAWHPGGFGENLTISGQSEQSNCIGDVFQIGNCVLQISQPRQPCWKLSERWQFPELMKIVQANGRTGWYYRVLEEGTIEPGQSIELLERPHPELTIAWAHSVMYAKPRITADDQRLINCPALSAAWREQLLSRSNK